MIIRADGGVINERRRLSTTGHVVVAVKDGEADVVQRGLPIEPEDQARFVEEASSAAAEAARASSGNQEKRREAIRLAVRRCATNWTGKKPLVDVLMFDQ